VSDGWEPLCGFLDSPVPEIPFPHLNDSREFADRIIDGALIAVGEWRSQEQCEPVDAAP
jgi:sulfotransferase family protein